MRNFLAAIWAIYNGLLTIAGHAILIFIGIVLCGYTLVQQYNPIHNTSQDVVIFLIGFALFSFSSVRRLIWIYLGIAFVWSLLAGAAIYLTIQDHNRFDFSPWLIAVAAVPPLAIMIFLKSSRIYVREEESDLQITLSSEKSSEEN